MISMPVGCERKMQAGADRVDSIRRGGCRRAARPGPRSRLRMDTDTEENMPSERHEVDSHLPRWGLGARRSNGGQPSNGRSVDLPSAPSRLTVDPERGSQRRLLSLRRAQSTRAVLVRGRTGRRVPRAGHRTPGKTVSRLPELQQETRCDQRTSVGPDLSWSSHAHGSRGQSMRRPSGEESIWISGSRPRSPVSLRGWVQAADSTPRSCSGRRARTQLQGVPHRVQRVSLLRDS